MVKEKNICCDAGVPKWFKGSETVREKNRVSRIKSLNRSAAMLARAAEAACVDAVATYVDVAGFLFAEGGHQVQRN